MQLPPPFTIDKSKLDPTWKIGIIHSCWYKDEVMGMVNGAQEFLEENGVSDVSLFEASGCFEIPLIGAALAEKGEFDALMSFGIIMEGETAHARMISDAVSRGLMDIQLEYQIPFTLEVLHVTSIEQAKARAFGEGNKGKEAAMSVLHSLVQLKSI